MTITCENCGESVFADNSFSGTQVRCPNCGEKIKVAHSNTDNTPLSENRSSGDIFLRTWEASLGGHSFSVILSLVTTGLIGAFYLIQCVRTNLFGIEHETLMWWLVLLEVVVNCVISISAFGLLGMFFSKSKLLESFLWRYFKLAGIVLIVDLLLSLGVVSAEYGDAVINDFDIRRPIMSAGACFFWAWFFHRIVDAKNSHKGEKRRR